MSLKSDFGLTEAQYTQLADKSGNRCYICGWQWHKPCRRLAVDHCHKTGVIRGLLCWTCNRGLGLFKDSPSLLQNAALYVKTDWKSRGWVIPPKKVRRGHKR